MPSGVWDHMFAAIQAPAVFVAHSHASHSGSSGCSLCFSLSKPGLCLQDLRLGVYEGTAAITSQLVGVLCSLSQVASPSGVWSMGFGVHALLSGQRLCPRGPLLYGERHVGLLQQLCRNVSFAQEPA